MGKNSYVIKKQVHEEKVDVYNNINFSLNIEEHLKKIKKTLMNLILSNSKLLNLVDLSNPQEVELYTKLLQINNEIKKLQAVVDSLEGSIERVTESKVFTNIDLFLVDFNEILKTNNHQLTKLLQTYLNTMQNIYETIDILLNTTQKIGKQLSLKY